jgi:hypothetical protein
MGQRGRQRVEESFTFEAQSLHYLRLFAEMKITRLAASFGERMTPALAKARG